MIRFINNNGDVFDGTSPYVHWLNGNQSVGLWYTLKLMIMSDRDDLTLSSFGNDSIFRFANIPTSITEETLDLQNILSTECVLSEPYVYDYNETHLYIYQIIIVCESDDVGQFTDSFIITSDQNDYIVNVGADFYGEDEILNINLSNRGMELPPTIQKAFLNNLLEEDKIDDVLLNRKFKELISNYIDIIDCKGSYKSLYNSLKWFEWGEDSHIYEIWKGADGKLFEKELELILKDSYQFLLTTHSKTTHISLTAALQKISGEELDEEKNPVVEDVDYINSYLEESGIEYKFSREEIMVKISILGAFFERYFMPIHLDLKRASAEAMVFTNVIKEWVGSVYKTSNYIDDTGVVDIDMDHVVTLGNIDAVAVGPGTVFGKMIDELLPEDTTIWVGRDFEESYNDDYGPKSNKNRYIVPVGVSLLEDINSIATESTDYDDPNNDLAIATFFAQVVGGVGVVVPITVSVPLPVGDGICCETITVYRDSLKAPQQVQERRLWMAGDDGYARFTFNLLSTKDEFVKFSLVLHSLSGHTWTAASSYQCIDVKGSYLNICKIFNTDNTGSDRVFNTVDEWMGMDNPYTSQYNTANARVNPKNHSERLYSPQILTQYIPSTDKTQFNQLILVQNPLVGGVYSTNWLTDEIYNLFWITGRGPEIDNVHKYVTLIGKRGGLVLEKSDFLRMTGLDSTNIKRWSNSYIPQLHIYEPIEGILQKDSHGYLIDNYICHSDDLLCVIPQFTKTLFTRLDIKSIKWEFKNDSTLETIEYDIPLTTPMIAHKKYKTLSPGYWTVTMYYRLKNSKTFHKLSKSSAFKII